ncbi:Probable sodium/metabolite cotransporter BASS2, partial [Durusdinium trenchii]
ELLEARAGAVAQRGVWEGWWGEKDSEAGGEEARRVREKGRMSTLEIAAAEACGDLECPIDNQTLPGGCAIPYEGSTDDFCQSVTIGNIAFVVVIISVAMYLTGAPLVGLFCQIFLNPLLMFALIAIFGSNFPIATRIMAILVASAPGGNGSNVLTLLSGGNVEMSVAMTVFSTFMAFATVPFFVWLGTEVVWKDDAAELDVDFVSIVLAALTATLLPAIGVAIKRWAPASIAHFCSKYLALIGAIAVLFGAFLYLFDPLFILGLKDLGWQIWICAALINAGGLMIGYSASRFVMGFPRPFHRTIAFEVGTQNATIPLSIAAVTFGSGPVSSFFLPFLGAYLIMSGLVSYSLMLFWRYGDPILESENQVLPSTKD